MNARTQSTRPPTRSAGKPCAADGVTPALPRLDIAGVFGGSKSSLSPVHLYIKDDRRRWVFLNEASIRLLGVSPETMLGSLGRRCIPKPLAELFCGDDKQVLDSGRPHTATRSIVWKGEARIFRQITWLHHEDGRRYVVGTLRDITAEEAHLDELRGRDSILAAVGKAAQKLLVPQERFAPAIRDTLRLLGTAADVSRAYVFETHEHLGAPVASQRFEWVARGVSAEIDNPRFQNMRLDGSLFTDAVETLSAGGAYQRHLTDLPPTERRFLAGQQIRSFLFVPIFLHGQLWGIVAFDECRRRRVWSSAEVDALRIAAGLLGAAIERNRTKLKLQEAAEEALRSREEIRLLRRHAETAREAEQKRLAHRLHDDFGQCLTMLTKDLVWLRKQPGAAAAEIQERIAQDMSLIADLLTLVRDISMELRPAVLDHFGLGAAVEWAAERFSKSSGIPAVVRTDGAVPMAKEREYAIFRILQELLTNAAKHSQATLVRISLAARRDRMILTVADNGVGLKAGVPAHKGALGLLGVRERAVSLGGGAKFKNGKNGGATAIVQIPILPQAEDNHNHVRNGKETRP